MLTGAALLALALTCSPVQAQDAKDQKTANNVNAGNEDGNAIVVTADRVGLLETRPNPTVFGLDKPLVETPRAATVASELTLKRYGIDSVTDLVAVSPGAGTASWFGIPGSVNLRGTMSDNFYAGYKRLPNFATYATPLGGASSVEIVRGPPTALYGPGKVGGFVNYSPMQPTDDSGRLITDWSGAISLTGGSYDKKNATASLKAPVSIGSINGGLAAYVEVDDSGSYFRGVDPSYQLYQLAGKFELGNGFEVDGSAMVYHSKGFVQVFTNRLTQDLVDNGTYVTGRDTTVVDADGNGRLTPNETSPVSFHNSYSGTGTAPIYARGTLDTGVGTTKISTRDVSVSDADFNNTTTQTYNATLRKVFDDGGRVELGYFMDKIKNDRYFSYGFPGHYRSNAQEARLSLHYPIEFSDNFKVNTIVGTSYRWLKAVKGESYLSGFVSVDRRDISYGATATDIFDDPFSVEPGGIGAPFNTYVHSKTGDAGAFAIVDATAFGRLSLLLAGRFDRFDVTSRDNGSIVYTVTKGQDYTAAQSDWTYSGSLTYKTDLGLIPYITHAEATDFEVNQAGDIQPGQIYAKNWLSDSTLTEGGVKFELLNGTLVGSLAGYKQKRRRNDPLTNTSIQSESKGLEFEFRYVINDNFSVNGSANRQKTKILGDTSTTYLPCYAVGLSGANCYGVNYRIGYGALYPDLSYTYSVIPKTIASLFTSYTTDEFDWGTAGATVGVVYTGKTSTLIPVNPVRYPAYAVVNLSTFVDVGKWTVSGNLTNLFNKRYYQPATDTTANVVTIPGVGREWKLTLGYKF